MSENDIPTKETFEFKAEMKQLLHLIIHSLYTHPEIFLRELISNASDALNKFQFAALTDPDLYQADAERKIVISGDKEAGTLTVTDTGIGMSREDLESRIGTIASSGTMAFIRELASSGKPVDGQMIGQFGVGFYSAFMVADRVVIETRGAAVEGEAWRWESDGEGSYDISPSERTERGTSVTLHLKEEEKAFSEPWRQKEVVRKYSNFVDFPIYVDDEQVNTVKALWRKSEGDITDQERTEFYRFVANAFDEPLGHLHLHVEGRVDFRALLFIPSKAPYGMFREDAEFGVHLYSSNVFIQDDCKTLLPDYLRFMRGVVDSEDLPLNVSREVTQNSPAMTKTRQILTGKILSMLKEWALEDPEKYASFFDEFGPLFKTGLASDFGNRDELLELVRYESTTTEPGKRTSLEAYVDRMQSGQEKVYYVLGSDRQSAEANPNLEYFRKKEIEVLLLIDPVDVFTVSGLTKVGDHEIVSAETAEIEDSAEDPAEDSVSGSDADKLIERIKSVLGDRVENVIISKRLVDSAATLVAGSQGMDAQMERMMRLMDESFAGSKKVLEINPNHALIRNLSALRQDAAKSELVEKAINQIYDGALLIEGMLESPNAFVDRMTALMVSATETGG